MAAIGNAEHGPRLLVRLKPLELATYCINAAVEREEEETEVGESTDSESWSDSSDSDSDTSVSDSDSDSEPRTGPITVRVSSVESTRPGPCFSYTSLPAQPPLSSSESGEGAHGVESRSSNIPKPIYTSKYQKLQQQQHHP